jgi:predicted nucleotidyltransferase
MKAVGLITEYNPMHNGHLYHLKEAKNMTKADVVLAVMSGDFVQRGEPAIIDKYSRCKAAIDAGVNLVIELPVYYALNSAEGFADGAVKILHELFADSFVFGSECGDLDSLSKAAQIITDEPEEYRTQLKDALANGLSFPIARQQALSTCLGCDMASLLTSPNNTLGIEYLKSVYKHSYTIKPHTIKRMGTGYNEEAIKNKEDLPSASAIRSILNQKDNNTLLNALLPETMHQLLVTANHQSCPVLLNDFTPLLHYKMECIFHLCGKEKERISAQLCTYVDINTELANRIIDCFDDKLTFNELAMKIKSRQYTYTRICRCLLHILLDITKLQMNKYDGNDVPYLRVLGFDAIGQKYLNHIKKKCSVPLITKTADYKDLLSDDIHAASIYRQVVFQKFHYSLEDEFHAGIYIK